jgi:hypothetical protein
MAYFEFFPKIEYNFNNQKTLEMVDIFRKVSFTQTTLNNEALFDKFYLSNGGSPEIVSFNLYGSSQFSWMLFASNQIVNPHVNWPREYTSLISELNSKYNGKVYYICRIPNILPGDVMIKIQRASCNDPSVGGDASSAENYTGCSLSYEDPITTYKIVKEWNQELRYILGVGGSSDFTEGDTFAILRKDIQGNYKPVQFGNSSGGETGPGSDGYVDVTIDQETFSMFRIAKIEEEKNAIVNFYQGTIVASPYRKVTSVDSNGSLSNFYAYSNANKNTYQSSTPIFADPEDFSGTVLDAYANGVLPTAITYKTKIQIDLEENEKAFTIKNLKRNYLDAASGLFKQALNSNQGRVLSIELNI